MKTYLEEVKGFLKNKVFIFCLVALAILAYGYAAVNKSISVDDLEYDRYVGSGNMMLAAGRFGIWFWSYLLGGGGNSYFMDLIAVVIMIWAIITLCILLRRVSSNRLSNAALTVFACMLISYPLILEIWEYTGSNVHIGGSFLFSSLSLLLIYEHIHKGSWCKPWRLIPASIMMMFVCAGYESVVSVYIFFVFVILSLQIVYGTEKEKKFLEIIRQGLIYAGVLAVGLILRLIVHRLTLLVLNLEPTINGATSIYWGTDSPITIIKGMISTWVHTFLLKAIIYPPLTIMLIACIVLVIIGICASKKYGAILLVPGLGMFLSLVILPILQGATAAYRTCQVFAPFCGFTAMILTQNLPQGNGIKKWLQKAALIGFACLFFYQASYINYFLELNHRRSEQEGYAIELIGHTLQTNFDQNKPVIFVGNYTLSEDLTEAISIPENSLRWKLYEAITVKAYAIIGKDTQLNRELPQTNVNSVISWSMLAFKQSSMQKLFKYYGYDYIPADYDSVFEEASAYAQNTNMPAYPYAGYIEDVGNYIIVNLQ